MRFDHLTLALCLILSPATQAFAAGTLRFTLPPDLSAEVEVLDWSSGEQGEVLEQVVAPGRVVLPPGTYALRVAGTDHRLGPVRLVDEETRLVSLGGVRVVAPTGAAPTFFFALSPRTGAVAAKVRSNAAAVALPPGTYTLARDLSDLRSALKIEAGQVAEVTCGALQLDAPGRLADDPFFVVQESDANQRRVAAYAHLGQGAQPLRPGTYRVVRERSGVLSERLEVRSGQVARLRCAALRVVALAKPVEYAVFRRADRVPLLRATTSTQGRLVFPGEYELRPWGPIAEAMKRRTEPALSAATPLLARAGQTTTLWITQSGVVGAGGRGEVPVEVRTLPGRLLVLGQPCLASVRVAEPAKLTLSLAPIDGGAGTKLAELDAKPPLVTPRLQLPKDAAEGAWGVLEAKLELPNGEALSGRSEPFLVAKPKVGAVAPAQVSATGRTTLTVTWSAASGELAGYRIYRAGSKRAIHGATLLAKETFQDIGLSAGRTYRYEVCAVDKRGLEGPRARVEAKTPR